MCKTDSGSTKVLLSQPSPPPGPSPAARRDRTVAIAAPLTRTPLPRALIIALPLRPPSSPLVLLPRPPSSQGTDAFGRLCVLPLQVRRALGYCYFGAEREAAVFPSRLSPRLHAHHVLALDRGQAVHAGDRPLDQHTHPRHHVLLLLPVCGRKASQVSQIDTTNTTNTTPPPSVSLSLSLPLSSSLSLFLSLSLSLSFSPSLSSSSIAGAHTASLAPPSESLLTTPCFFL